MRKAFTIIEVLVCISIIGVLAALIVPAVLNAREAAKRAEKREISNPVTSDIEDVAPWENVKYRIIEKDGHKFFVFWTINSVYAVEVKDKAEADGINTSQTR